MNLIMYVLSGERGMRSHAERGNEMKAIEYNPERVFDQMKSVH